jgi:peptidoglycan/LPS O-acetylase OafA/YrhL
VPSMLGVDRARMTARRLIRQSSWKAFGMPVDLVKDRLPLHGLLRPFYEAGEYGVWVFWCISGFIFFWKYRDAIHDRSMHGWTFFVFRLSRLYPLHLVTLALVAILQSAYFRQQF